MSKLNCWKGLRIDKMKIKAWHKETKQWRQLETLEFDADGNIDFVRTVDPDTGHDPWDGLADEYDFIVEKD